MHKIMIAFSWCRTQLIINNNNNNNDNNNSGLLIFLLELWDCINYLDIIQQDYVKAFLKALPYTCICDTPRLHCNNRALYMTMEQSIDTRWNKLGVDFFTDRGKSYHSEKIRLRSLSCNPHACPRLELGSVVLGSTSNIILSS